MAKKSVDIKTQILLIRKDLKYLKEQFDNHLKHHWALTLALLGITGSLIAALITVLLS